MRSPRTQLTMADGHCLHGQLRLVASGEPKWVARWRCASCRHHTASALACVVNHPLARLGVSGSRAS